MEINKTNFTEFFRQLLIEKGGDSYLGEQVTMQEHMLQCAHLAVLAKAENYEIIAALLHDIGHYWGEFGCYSPDDTQDKHHEVSGKILADMIFPKPIGEIIGLHVAAKRYLCATNQRYYDALSPASQHTLTLQGGAFNPQEVKEFEKNQYYKSALKVRVWDDKAKVPNLITPDFDYYIPILHQIYE